MNITQRDFIISNLNDNPHNLIKTTVNKQKRNYGLDLLRIFSMISIINLHINLRTGFLRANKNDIKYKTCWRLESFSFFGVNCFGLISGIVGFHKYKFSNLIYLWFISAFYSVLECSFLFFRNRKNLTQLFFSFFPIITRYHWYVNAYFIMYLFLPFINLGINILNVETFRILVLLYISFFSIYYLIRALFTKKDYSFLISGYSSSWLTILYIIGSYFGKYILERISKSNIFIKFFNLMNYIGFSLLSSEIFFRTGNNFLINYLSPTILFQALSLVMIFHSINIKNKSIIKVIKFITPLVFSATLIHLILFKFKIVIFFFYSNGFNEKFLFFKIYLISLIVFIICIIIDFFRLLLFNFLRIREFCIVIENFFPKVFNKLLLFIKLSY